MTKLPKGVDPLNWSEADFNETISSTAKSETPLYYTTDSSNFPNRIHQPTYICKVHGEVNETITSTLDSVEDVRCIKCYWENVVVPNTEKVTKKDK